MINGVTVKVPGKVMLAGEYGVLRGGGAAACTINQALTVQFQDVDDDILTVESDIWDEPREIHHNNPDSTDPLTDCVRFCAEKYDIKRGKVRVTSKLDLHHGVGSSSALRLGTVLAMATFARQTSPQATDRWDLARDGFMLQQKMQSFASGYDLATQNLGGLVVVRPLAQPEFWPGSITRISSITEELNQLVTPFVGGKGAPTGPVARETIAWAEDYGKWDAILQTNESLIERMVQWVTGEVDKQEVFAVCKQHRELFEPSPHFPKNLASQIEKIPGCDEVWSYKTTGAGGEDALLVLGDWSLAKGDFAKLGWSPAPFHFNNSGAAITLKKGAHANA